MARKFSKDNASYYLNEVYKELDKIKQNDPTTYNRLHDVIFQLENVNMCCNIPFMD